MLDRLRERVTLATSIDMDQDSEHSLLAGHQGGPSTSSTWYIDSGASSHMTGAREVFSELSETGRDVEVVLGGNTVVRAVGRGTITFQRESMSPMTLRDVLYVPGLKKNLYQFPPLRIGVLGCAFHMGECRCIPRPQVCPVPWTLELGVESCTSYCFSHSVP